jgi:uncharacterized membrane protein YhaH (DUF805 family)
MNTILNSYFNTFKKYVVFQGRANRYEYWSFQLLNFVIYTVLLLLSNGFESPIRTILVTLFLIFALAVIIPSLAVTIRRLHDSNHSGWWLFISFVPFIGGIIVLIFSLTKSDSGENKYGANPELLPMSPSIPTV